MDDDGRCRRLPIGVVVVAGLLLALGVVSGPSMGPAGADGPTDYRETFDRVSVAWNEADTDGESWAPSMSSDGRHVAFLSRATNLVEVDRSGVDVFVRDRQGAVTHLASGALPIGVDASEPRISATGEYVVFVADGSVYRYSTATHELVNVTTAVDGPPVGRTASHPDVSADGNLVTFRFLVPDPDEPWRQVGKVRLIDLSTLEVVEVATVDSPYVESGPFISDDGAFILYSDYGVEKYTLSTQSYDRIAFGYDGSCEYRHVDFNFDGNSHVALSFAEVSGCGGYEYSEYFALADARTGAYPIEPFYVTGTCYSCDFNETRYYTDVPTASGDGRYLVYPFDTYTFYVCDDVGCDYRPSRGYGQYLSYQAATGAHGPVTTSSGMAPSLTADLDMSDIAVSHDGSVLAFVTDGDKFAIDENGLEDVYIAEMDLAAPVPTCDGAPAAIVDAGVILGTSRGDVIVGSAGDDQVTGGTGFDRICTGDGNDFIDAGVGSDEEYNCFEGRVDPYCELTGDVVLPGSGDDEVHGGTEVHWWQTPEVDTIAYDGSTGGVNVNLTTSSASGPNIGNDAVYGFENVRGTGWADVIVGDDADNQIWGFGGDDDIDGHGGNDIVRGGVGNDVLSGGLGSDQLFGGPGDDVLSGGAGNDTLDGGTEDSGEPGFDICVQGSGSGPARNCESTKLPLTVTGTSVVEPDSGIVAAEFTVTIPAPTDKVVRFTARTVNVTATSADYVPRAPMSFTIPAGTTALTIAVSVRGDLLFEPDEMFALVLSAPSANATLGAASAVATIVNNDPAPQLSIDDLTIAEGNAASKTVRTTIRLAEPAPTPISVRYRTINGTAIAPGDYVAIASRLVTISKGKSTAIISLTVKGGKVPEPDETFIVELFSPSGAILSDPTAIVTILNDD